MLKINNLNVHYGVIHALKDVSIEVNEGEIVSLIGANGAGKTTLLKAITNLYKATNGQIEYEGALIQKASSKKIVKSGISLVPEGRHVFAGLTVKENLELGAHLRKDPDGIKKDIESMCLKFPILKERMDQDSATLSGGEQQMLVIARALMSKPRLLLLDEPSMGLAPLYIKEIFNIIKEINASGTTILLVEQNAKMALSIANRGYVLENGTIALQGTGQELLNSEEVTKAYLGG